MEGKLGRFINKVRGRTEASPRPQDRWAEYERRLPGFRTRMLRARQDLEAGRWVIINPDITGTPVNLNSPHS